ncbi:MAG: beta-propeller fold lactonase family protein [Proteobacteria bacterium]|nr:beta-propeller fold lactonase family protein [Pseudomonadota bacterium]MBU1138322.1 beta-propeller fold lactonase family protein [Pseudomonadota bacterium]MBU1419000.1 beta-propeller fold lactonase family protein [Pseudomonadota bacterium]MBU1455072.1 beta-propeller fold lactonase family protein [Pseudomonadota bacterium]
MPFGKAFGSATANPSVQEGDLVFICNEDSNTLTVIDPISNSVKHSVNLTSFDEDPRPPFRFATGGVTPTHTGMVTKALYHGAINIHGAAPSPDQTLIATTGRGTSNIYLVDTRKMSLIGNRPNPKAGDITNQEIITSGILVGREPHEPTFSRNGKEIWVALRGEDRIAILDTEKAKKESTGMAANAIRLFQPTLYGPAQVWFSKDGGVAFVISQKVSQIDVLQTNVDSDGFSHPTRIRTIDIKAQDPYGFTPFQKITPDGREMWFSHKIADVLSSRSIYKGQALVDLVSLGAKARPNHVEFVENIKGKVVYASLGRVDDGGPGGAPSSRIMILDRTAKPGQRKVVGSFFSHGREAHGIWTNPAHDLVYIAHEQDELPGTPNEGQTVCTVFNVADPLQPVFVKQIPLGSLLLPSGNLRNKKSINLVYIRPGLAMHSG